MELSDITSLLANPAELHAKVEKLLRPIYELDAVKQFDPNLHRVVKDEVFRPKKKIEKGLGTFYIDAITETERENVEIDYKDVSRLPIPLQKLIVKRTVSFAVGGKIDFKCAAKPGVETDLFNEVVATWKRNKMQFKVKELLTYRMSELECAVLWHSVVNADKTISMRATKLAPSLGDSMSPIFNSDGDMVSFMRSYQVGDVKHFDVYTDTQIIKHVDTGQGYNTGQQTITNHGYYKIPAVYDTQPRAQWSDVQRLIEREETLISDHSDTNINNASPILTSNSEIKQWFEKGDQGKVVEMEEGGELKYVTWDNAPQSIDLEDKNLRYWIFSCTQTPNISFEELKGMGNLTGPAFDRIMIDGHMNAKDIQDGSFGEFIQRNINFLISAVVATGANNFKQAENIDIEPVFNLFKIDDIVEKINNAKLANGGLPVTDHESSIQLAGLSDNAADTLKKIKAETPVAPTVINPASSDRIPIAQ